ncbi:Induced myeloid leukemia cell differentiation protein [Collichthys lucidus]|uniref:Induced myeloid leukemia cell differentiation protein n=1 Tax=Collichthys lucidus TaxID=240159 RepID=A0A4U5ULI4_COLLU|nr:Induced myeloid leukemia cell differentiation protein [Collichthys lucidus]
MQGPDIFVLSLNRAGGALSQRSEFDVLNDPNVMIHLDGTYDTYQCKDCNIVLSALKRGDPGFEEHLWHGGGECRYFRIKYVGREEELTISKGKLRFQKGFLALPQFFFSAINGYVPIGNTRHCIVCASPDYQHHHFQSACAEMARRIIVSLKHLTLDVHIDNTPLFSPLRRINNFSVLGESANMYHIPGTLDTHKCVDCKLEIKDFVVNDYLLGEHIYHVYNQGGRCSYLEKKFENRKDELMVILGKERYRRGLIAFETTVTKAEHGFAMLNGQRRCLTLLTICNSRGFFEELPVDDKGDKVMSLSVLAHSIFADGAINWGRIVSLVAFGVVVCQNSNKEEEEERLALVESVGEKISTYLLTDQRDWLLKNNSWVGFVEFYAEPVPEPESEHVLVDKLLCIAGFAVIGALIYLCK